MRSIVMWSVAVILVLAMELACAESQFDSLVEKGNPPITIFVNGPEQKYQINGRIEGDKKTIQKELQRLTNAFGSDLPLALVVSPDTTVSQLQEWIVICHMSNANTIRAYVSAQVNWNNNQRYEKSQWFDVK